MLHVCTYIRLPLSISLVQWISSEVLAYQKRLEGSGLDLFKIDK